MQKTDKALLRMIDIEEEACKNSIIHKIHPSIKLLLTVVFLGFLVSYDIYNLAGVFVMGIYPLIMFTLSGISFRNCLHRIWIAIPLFGMFGIFNIFTNKTVAYTMLGVGVSYGIISFFVLLLKGVYAVISGYILIATTGIENICYGLQCLHCPKMIVTQCMLTYRYIGMLITQAEEIYTAYLLRSPGKKGISLKVWGPLVGQLLLRTTDRGQVLYESMTLRGFCGSFQLKRITNPWNKGMQFLIIWGIVFIVFRFYSIPRIVGMLILNFL